MNIGLGIIIGLALIIFVIVAIVYFLATFNTLVLIKNNTAKAWSNIDVLLKQRNDEIPNLVSCVKGYMVHEQELLEKITTIRSSYQATSDINAQSNLASQQSGILKNIFAVSENYPDLKASDNFLALQKRLSGLETQIAQRREYFNDAVNTYNTRLETFPDLILAGLLGYKTMNMFVATAEEKKNIQVEI